MLFFRKRKNKELESILNELRMNLENNYKALALDAFAKLKARTEELHNDNLIDERLYSDYKKIIEEYEISLKDYHH